MGGPPQPGEDQEVVVSVTGPEKGDKAPDVDSFNADFKKFTTEVQDLRKKYPRLKVKVGKISYKKRDPQDSFEYREWKA
jgi:hypothetical protein